MSYQTKCHKTRAVRDRLSELTISRIGSNEKYGLAVSLEPPVHGLGADKNTSPESLQKALRLANRQDVAYLTFIK